MTSRYPVPTKVLSNGEFRPLPQTAQQKQAEQRLLSLADRYGGKQGLSRRQFLKSASGMAAAFLAMNSVYGPVFDVLPAEAADLEVAEAIRNTFDQQFIFDVQLHFIRDQYAWQGLTGLRRYARNWNRDLKDEKTTLKKLQFENFIDEVFRQSQTKIGLLSGAPSDDPAKWFLTNDEIAKARSIINSIAGSRRLLGHAIFTPGQPGWLEEMDRAIEELHPDSWKGYTIGDPLGPSQYPWRLDDEKLVYPAYEKMVRAGIRNVCIHKGLLPDDYSNSMAGLWKYATVDDVGKAAQEWPQLNFIIYHSALRPLQDLSAEYLKSFEETGYIPWVTELADIPSKYGVSNLYAELGTAFATSAVSYPRHCAVLLGTLIKGFGVDRVLWGTDSVWYGSPQWQIEAFRRIEIPADLRKKFSLKPLGKPDGLIKTAIFGLNAARLYNIELHAGDVFPTPEFDKLAKLHKV
jgi:predicted TIM-barrel fold metal-dependent hydrolase